MKFDGSTFLLKDSKNVTRVLNLKVEKKTVLKTTEFQYDNFHH